MADSRTIAHIIPIQLFMATNTPIDPIVIVASIDKSKKFHLIFIILTPVEPIVHNFFIGFYYVCDIICKLMI